MFIGCWSRAQQLACQLVPLVPGMQRTRRHAFRPQRRRFRPALECLETRTAPAIFTVNTLADTVDADSGVTSLREAITAANTAAGADTVTFSVSGTINLTGALPTLSTELAIVGPGADLLTVRRDTGGDYRVFNVGGGVPVSVSGLTVANGRTDRGAAFGVANGVNLNVDGVRATGNTATVDGGVMLFFGGGTVSITDSTFDANTAAGSGGAIWLGQGTVAPTLLITNSTFSGNTAVNNGGAIRLFSLGNVQLLNTTFSGNSAASGGALAQAGGTIHLQNTLLAGNTATTGPNIHRTGGTMTSLGNNLLGNNSGASYTPAGGDIVGTSGSPINPQLGPLQDNGGPTPTRALLSGSPALETANNSAAPAVDQRGVSRPRGTNVDIGAFELQYPFVVNTLADTVDANPAVTSLREAITAANAAAGADTISFSVSGTINLTGTLPTLNTELAIVGPGADLLTVRRDTGDDYRIATVGSGAPVSVSGLTIANGRTDRGAAFAIGNGADLSLDGVRVTGNTATVDGGAMLFVGGGTVSITDSTFDANTAAGSGGAIWLGQGAVAPTLEISNSTFSGNSAVNNGGAIRLFSLGSVKLVNSTFSGNSASSGGALAQAGGSIDLSNTLLAGNTASSGPDIRRTAGTMTSQGHNLLGNNSGAGFTAAAGDLVGTSASPINPQLGPLQDNGGMTPTRALLPASPAINAGDNALVPAGVAFDQRGAGFPRIRYSLVDIGAFEIQNLPPTDITLSNNLIPENLSSGTLVGTFSSIDPDAADSFTYTLVAGTGSTDNASFTISGLQLRTAAIFNFEAKAAYSIRVRSTDAGGLFTEEAFTINVANVNEAPTNIALNNNTVAENAPSGTTLGTFSTTDPDAGDSFTYTLIAGAGSSDNASFTINGSQLRTAAVFDFEAKSAYSIRVRSTDAGGLFTEIAFTISVIDVDESPPVSSVDALPVRSTTLSFTVSVTGADASAGSEPASGVSSYDIYVYNGGWSLWTTVAAGSPSAVFNGTSNNSYGFYSIARDIAGNTEAKAPIIEAGTYVPDLTPPDVHAVSVDTTSANFIVSWSGTATGGSGLSAVDLYVSVDGGAAAAFAQIIPGSPVGGVYSGTTAYQAISDGTTHSYRFYARGINGNGVQQAATATGDITVNASFAAPASLQVTGFSVAHGLAQRSFIRYVDVTFNLTGASLSFLNTGTVRLQKFALDGSGTGTNIDLSGKINLLDYVLELDFGSLGLGGAPGSTAGDGYYKLQMDLDNNGSFETERRFYRLLGDVNGDRAVTSADVNLITLALGRTGSSLNEDVNGDGYVNALDRLYAIRSLGRMLGAGLQIDA